MLLRKEFHFLDRKEVAKQSKLTADRINNEDECKTNFALLVVQRQTSGKDKPVINILEYLPILIEYSIHFSKIMHFLIRRRIIYTVKCFLKLRIPSESTLLIEGSGDSAGIIDAAAPKGVPFS
ncbi:hypothetical protein CEXT_124851 [Caerostris extrusa]|uniref:Uncharacterized protein n=1 Tax=Caerostris extrusa TaxID=172846 RepID=A0AAV4QPC7_CAEEX|nr:hypothetical protein CEXT_124851 [Caerostris extrusa]